MMKSLPLMALVILSACSHHSQTRGERYLASVDASLTNSDKLQSRVEKLTESVFHSYLIGQTYLYEFDRQLDQNPQEALKSDAYHSLLAIRTLVDKFEHEMDDLYVDLVLATSLPRYSEGQKENAQTALNSIGNFMEGMRTNNTILPENLRPLILANLQEKQTKTYAVLKDLRDDSHLTGNDRSVKQKIQKNMALIRGTRMSFHKELKKYKVNKKVLSQTIKEEKKKRNYQDLLKQIESLSEQMKEFTAELGRGTSSDVIYPTAGPNGNISGRTFPEKTWSLTYDDGPGKTTPQIVANLKERQMKATFFMLAKQVETNPVTSQLIKDEGHDIASHSYTHAQLTKVGSEQLEREISGSKMKIQEKLKVDIKLFRLPYGAGTSVSSIRSKIAENNMVHVFWTVDTLDWQDKNPQSIFNRTIKQMNASGKNAGIILFHDIHPQTVIASTMIMDYLKEKRLKVCTVQAVVDQINQGLESCE